MKNPSTSLIASKDHYLILDGLRGVASLIVVLFHICEAYSPDHPLTQPINHGYLAVDFFFLLSGFVIAYAYDDRWEKLSILDFFKRRLIRLQPMVIMGMTIGAALFYFQAGPAFPLIGHTPIWEVFVVMLVGYTLLPLPMTMDIRGWGEMHPLDGPAWSLFFEYVANILYAIGLRKLSSRWLMCLAVLAAAFLVHLAVFGKQGDLIGGWSINAEQLHIGFARLLFPFIAGLLLMRLGKRIRIKGAFAVSSLLLIVVLSLPRFGGSEHLWLNGLYESACVIIIFPAIVAMGAGATLTEGGSKRAARFLGGLSYPLYITHYPLIYIYTNWMMSRKPPFAQSVGAGVMVLVGSLAIAYICLKFYDEPVRSWLSRKFLKIKVSKSHVGAVVND